MDLSKNSKEEFPNPINNQTKMGNSETKPPKKKMNKWLKWILISLGLFVILFFLLGYFATRTIEQTLTPASTAIVGPAGDTFEVVDKPVTAFVNGNGIKMSVNLKRIGEGSVSSLDFNVELIGENDDVLAIEEDHSFDNQNLDTLDGLREGETSSIKINIYTDRDLSTSKIKKFRIISKNKKIPEIDKEKTVDELIDDLVNYVGNASEFKKNAEKINDEGTRQIFYMQLADLEKPILKIKDKLIKAEANGEVTEGQKKRIKALFDKLSIIEGTIQNAEGYNPMSSDSDITEYEETKDLSDNTETSTSEETISKVSATSAEPAENDWESLLYEYEKCVNELSTLVKKAKEGDTTVLDEYEEAKENAIKLKNRLTKAEGSMTKKQAARFALLSVKLARAILK